MKTKGPPILPMYKVTSNQKKKGGGLVSILIAVLLPIIAVFLLVFFFLSIYMGSTYLQQHLQDESPAGLLGSVGLPNTRNNIQKWSIDHLHGIDITKLGPPPKVEPQGLGSQHNQHRYNLSESLHAVNAGLDTITHRIGDTIGHIYYNNSAAAASYTQVHQGSAKLNAWLNSFAELNTTSITHSLDTHKLRTYIADKTDRAVKGISELGQRGVNNMNSLRGVNAASSVNRAKGAALVSKNNPVAASIDSGNVSE